MSESETVSLTRDLVDKIILEARIHAGEASAANATIYEIYQLLTGATGEPGNWNGADPARSYVETTNRYREALRDIAAHEPNESHNHNLNDLIAVEAVRRARKALEA